MRSNLSRLFSLVLLLVSAPLLAADLKLATNLRALAQQSPGEVVVLMVSQQNCSYCVRVKEQFLIPLQNSRNAPPIRILSLSQLQTVIDFDGTERDAKEIAKRYGARFTPTLLFVDAQGNSLHEPIVGLNTPDFYGYYLDQAIEQSRNALH